METWNRSIHEVNPIVDPKFIRWPGAVKKRDALTMRIVGGKEEQWSTTREGVMTLTRLRYTSTLSRLNAPGGGTRGLPCERSCDSECISNVGAVSPFQHPRPTQ